MIRSGSLRIAWAAALLAAAAAALACALLELGVRTGGSAPVHLAWAAAAVLLAGWLGFAGGNLLARRLLELRRFLQLRPDPRAPAPAATAYALREVHELAQAADLLATQVSRRAGRLEQQSLELARLVEFVSDGLVRIGPGGRIEFVNPAARALLALPPEASGQPIAALVRSLELRQLIDNCLRGERSAGTEIAIGDRRVLVSGEPLPTPAGAVPGSAGAVLAVSDLTALRRLEGVRRDFVANVSHELKTPLTSIRGYADTLLADTPPPDLQRQFLEVIQRNAARLQRIVDELLDLSMIESGGWQPGRQDVVLEDLAAEVWTSFADSAAERSVSFRAPGTRTTALADPAALRQVLGNLIDNALRYTPPGGAIELRTTPAEGQYQRMVTVEIADTGTGIPSEALPRIFERFYRVDPARSRAAGGTGLGLAIVKHMVESMGGEVSADSVLGKGTTVRFTLPAASAAASPVPRPIVT